MYPIQCIQMAAAGLAVVAAIKYAVWRRAIRETPTETLRRLNVEMGR